MKINPQAALRELTTGGLLILLGYGIAVATATTPAQETSAPAPDATQYSTTIDELRTQLETLQDQQNNSVQEYSIRPAPRPKVVYVNVPNIVLIEREPSEYPRCKLVHALNLTPRAGLCRFK